MKRYSQQQIGDLLDKFMAGLTTLDEEAALGDYLRTHQVPPQWEDYRLMFDYFDRGMEGSLPGARPAGQPLLSVLKRRWWGIAAAAAITAAIFALAALHRPGEDSSPGPIIARVDTPAVITIPASQVMQGNALYRMADATPPTPPRPDAHAARPATVARARHLQAQNDSLRAITRQLQRELEDLRRRAFVIDMEANGYKAVMGEDGNVVFIDLEQEIENEFNQQTTKNNPAI